MFRLILSTPPNTASHPPPKENAKKDPPINSPNVCSKPSWCGPWTQYLLCCTELLHNQHIYKSYKRNFAKFSQYSEGVILPY